MDPASVAALPHSIYPKNLWNMLGIVADGKNKDNEIVYFQSYSRSDHIEKRQSYQDLRKLARSRSMLLRSEKLERVRLGSRGLNRVIVLYFDTHEENINWFWAVVALGWIPCISPPFKGSFIDHGTHINGLRRLLEEPIFLTNSTMMPLFRPFNKTTIRIRYVDEIESWGREPNQVYCFPGGHMMPDDVAMIALTSGSNGVAKAVAIKQSQIFRSLEGKQKMHATTASDSFLNWTDFSHVASVMETHLHALHLGAMQVQVHTKEIIHNPIKLLSFVDKYRISYTFAPNFLLTAIIKALQLASDLDIVEDWVDQLDGADMATVLDALTMRDRLTAQQQVDGEDKITKGLLNRDDTHPKWELGCLRALISGGESNVVDTCRRFTEVLQKYNAPASFIRPGFGMTETCAGCIYSTWCPGFDLMSGLEFASLGEPIVNAQMRIISSNDTICAANEVGELQVKGPAIFDHYYNDLRSTKIAFTDDGWFRTGDMARISNEGQLYIEGRYSETLTINGVKHYPQLIETALEDAKIEGMRPSYTAVFPHRPRDEDDNLGTECLCIVYIPTYDHFNRKARAETLAAICKAVVHFSGVRPYKVLPLSERILHKSVLGKLSRPKIRANFEGDLYQRFERDDERLLLEYQKILFRAGTTRVILTDTEKTILRAYNSIFYTGLSDVTADCNIFDLGVGSLDLLKLRVELMNRLDIKFPVTFFFEYTTVAKLAAAFDGLSTKTEYTPVVVLQPKLEGMTKTPIFFIHPGMGEVLIFMNLARHLSDRPVYALRARGFDGEDFFKDMDEMIECYHAAIKKTQLEGPYALAGYSFGSILTWEIAKRMQAAGDEVKFLATFDQAPYLKERSREYDWYECVVSIGFFLNLIPEECAHRGFPDLRCLTHDEVLFYILEIAPPEHVREVGITASRLDRWANLALAMKKLTWEYDPEGLVPHMDIFWTVPLIGIVAAETKEEWRNWYIGQWDVLVEKPIYYFVGGGHRTMINPPHLNSFQKLFKKVMEERGI